jgi:lipopolysaccharide/colanic/teichoic acid biosynthesis glycosyltransferase
MNLNSPLLDESVFKRMLSLERRRCERTNDRFALMLVDMEELKRTMSVAAIEEIALTISTAMRETDVSGWYCEHSVLGIILTTLNGADRSTLEAVIGERMRSLLALSVDDVEHQRIWITWHIFPEDTGADRAEEKAQQLFYSDEEKKDLRSMRPAIVKRALDITVSLAALFLSWPLFLTIALMIKLTSKGPVLFRQKRIGQFGEEFTFLKFRSMYANNDPTIHKEYIKSLIAKQLDGSQGGYKMQNDPRVTPLGRFLRKSSFDELPQFINVLRGEMSLVGPRPPIRYEFENYSLWHRRRILEAKPGITGIWQVQGRSRTTFDEMVRMDLRYIRNQSLWLDVKILFRTPVAMVSGNGAH